MIKKNVVLYFLIFLISMSSVSAYITQGNVYFHDDYTTESDSNDAITWLDITMFTWISGYPVDTDAVCWDWDGNGDFSACWISPSDPLNRLYCSARFSDVEEICNIAGCGWDFPGTWRDMWTSREQLRSIGKPNGDGNPINVHFYTDCDTPFLAEEGEPENNERWYYILSDRNYVCKSEGGVYKDIGYYGTGWTTIDSSISCSAGYGCDGAKEDDFGSDGVDKPSAPCSKTTGSCATNDDCVSPNPYCDYDTNICVSDHCGNNHCDEGLEDYWNCKQDCPTGPCSGIQCEDIWGNKICWNSGSIYAPWNSLSAYYCNNGDWLTCGSGSKTCTQAGRSDFYCISGIAYWRWKSCTYGCKDNSCNPEPKPIMVLNPDEDTGLTFNLGV